MTLADLFRQGSSTIGLNVTIAGSLVSVFGGALNIQWLNVLGGLVAVAGAVLQYRAQLPYVQMFTHADWSVTSDGDYEIIIPFHLHRKAAPQVTFETLANGRFSRAVPDIATAANGDVIVAVATMDSGLDRGRIVVKQAAMLGLVLTLTGIVIGMIAGFTSIHLLVAIGGAMAVVGAALQYIDSTAYIMPLEKMKWRRREDGNFEARIPAWRHRKKLPMIEILEPTPGATAGLVSSDSDDRGNILLVRSGPCSAILRLV